MTSEGGKVAAYKKKSSKYCYGTRSGFAKFTKWNEKDLSEVDYPTQADTGQTA